MKLYLTVLCLSVSLSLSLKVNVNPADWDGYTEPNPPPPPPVKDDAEAKSADEAAPVIGHWNERLTEFQKMIMVRIFKEEKVCVQHTRTWTYMYIHMYIHA